MIGKLFRRQRAGRRIEARTLNLPIAEVDRLSRLTVAAPLGIEQSECGPAIRLARPSAIIARITSGTNPGPYAWTEQRPWNPAERVDLATMIAMYTINAAYQNHLEHETGSIEVGKLADLIVLDRNLFTIPAGEIHTVRVERTLMEGKTLFGAGGERRR